MSEIEERDLLLASLKGYLEELKESGVDELAFGTEEKPAAVAVEAPVTATAAVSVTGVGNQRARMLLVMTGTGFEGASGALLAKIVIAMGFAPEDVFLLTFPEEEAAAASLRDALFARVADVSPEIVVALGETAAQLLIGSNESISKLRGRFIDVNGTPLMATLHPDQLLADESLKREVWNEMKQVIALLAGKTGSR